MGKGTGRDGTGGDGAVSTVGDEGSTVSENGGIEIGIWVAIFFNN